jgi:hypothetical protein
VRGLHKVDEFVRTPSDFNFVGIAFADVISVADKGKSLVRTHSSGGELA